MSEEKKVLTPETLIEAAKLIIQTNCTSVGFIARRMNVDRRTAIDIMKSLEDKGIVGPWEGTDRIILTRSLDQILTK